MSISVFDISIFISNILYSKVLDKLVRKLQYRDINSIRISTYLNQQRFGIHFLRGHRLKPNMKTRISPKILILALFARTHRTAPTTQSHGKQFLSRETAHQKRLHKKIYPPPNCRLLVE
ncbi:hypothetical protein AAMO2058_000129000 [Amorphochlora amoebiformis]